MIFRNEQEKMEELEDDHFWEINPRTVTFFLMAMALIVGIITFLSFYDGMKVKSQEEVANYVNEMNQLLIKSKHYSDSVEDSLTNGTMAAFAKEDEQEFRTLMVTASKLSVPLKWEAHQEAAAGLITARYMFFYQYQQNVRLDGEEIEEKLTELEKLEKVEKEVLLSSFDASSITYRESEEGKITFSIKTY
ncbi:hypothetical protein [Bacillus sp. CHD6a]|uniref:hypothetical protein n=1 Tax=Bacillus sp. CHD6a TaxID=1643452 RepID=UPI0006CC6DE3|nr:hypothetical protein [Bacillus sp. CHD6a]KPB06133.1 hypothetical protein AAV98_04270 [Bacillus sp. CHD6a]